MAEGGWKARIPIWIRVPGLIALVLVGVFVSAALLSGIGDSGGHSGANHTMNAGPHGSGDGGSHGAGHSGG